MKSTVIKAEWIDVNPGLHRARFIGREGPKPGKFGEFIVWKFEVQGPDEVLEYQGITSDAFVASNRCKAFRWACAIDVSLSEDTIEWDDENCEGAIVTVALEYQDPENPGFLRVKEVYPLQK